MSKRNTIMFHKEKVNEHKKIEKRKLKEKERKEMRILTRKEEECQAKA